MIVKTTIAIVATIVIVMGIAGSTRAQPPNEGKDAAVIQLAAQMNNDNDKSKKNYGHNNGNKKSGTPNFSGPKPSYQMHRYGKKPGGSNAVIQYHGPKTGTQMHQGKQMYQGNKYNKKYIKPKTTTRVVTPKGRYSKTVTGRRLRGIPHSGSGQFFVRGRNFSTWRGAHYRRRYHDRWVTFVPLSVLAGILIGERNYYPYAYIDAPPDYCEGLTEDGCELVWDDVETEEGDLVGQCVAYCPWRPY